MGTCKLSLPLGDKRLGTMALNEIFHSRIDYLLVVTKEEHSSWLNSSTVLRQHSATWENVVSLQARLGQSYSLRTGILRAKQLGAESIIIFLADQPFITSHLINRLIEKSNDKHSYVASLQDGVLKPPILFNRTVFSELLSCRGDQGARSLLRKGTFPGTSIPVVSDELIDIDTVEEYEYAHSKLASCFEYPN